MFNRSRLPRANALFKLIVGFAGTCLVLSAQAVLAAPPAPADIYGSGVDSTQVTLTWLPSTGATSYNVGRSITQGGPYTTVATGIASTSYTNTGLSNNGTKYYFIVTATNSTGTSGNSGELWVVTPNPSNTSAISATATVNWATSAGTTTPALYGTNDIPMAFQSQTCSSTQDAAYFSNLTQMGTTFYRLLSSGLSGYVTCDGGSYSGWTDTNQTWDTVLPPREFAQPYLQGATTIMNVPGTAPWMAPNATVDPNTYANFCAQLVTQVKGMPYSHPTYWEPMNEWWCVTGPTMTQIDNVFNACSSAMRAADPNVKMAGPVTCYLDTGIMTTFLQNCGANVDCVTWHHYPSCAATDSTDTIMNNTPSYGSEVSSVRGLINTYCPNPSAVKIAVDEYSIPCAWDEGETRQDSNVAAAFFASVLKNLAYAGCDIGAQWGAKDGIYGVMSLDDAVMYPAATVYQWANRYLVGTLYSTTSTNGMVEVMAIKKPDNSQTVLLINKASGTATVTLNLGLGSSSVNIGSIDSSGVHAIAPATLGSSVTMSPCSVKIIQLPATGTTGLVSLNCGGPAASPYIADADFGAGNAATNWTGTIDTSAVTSPAPQAVYQSERYGTNTYVIPGLTANATYTVRLHFCENYFTASGLRKFNVIINGTQDLTNFDIFATAGAIHKANIQQFSTTADSSGQITIIFATTVNNALVNGIQILPAIPPPPTGLTATGGNTQVALSWNASSGATAYDVKRSTVSGSGYATVSSPTTNSYTNTGLTNGTTYYFVVDAKNTSGASANSVQVSATPTAGSPPPAPTGLASVPGIAEAWLTWTASTGATTYNVKRSTVNGSGYATVASPATTYFMNTGLTNGTTYYYVVTAVSSGGESGNSAQVSAAPSATVPQAQIASGTATIDGIVEAAWNNAPSYLLCKTTGVISSYSDCTATWKGMWDATNLYVLIDVTDDVKKNDSTAVYDDDAPEIYLDADHNGGTSYDANDRQLEFGWGDATVVEGQGRATTGVTFAKVDPASTFYRMEIKIPWALEVFTPAANAIIGIDVHVNDDDDGGTRDGKVIWNDGTDQAWTNPSLFGTGKLLAAATGSLTGSVANIPASVNLTTEGTIDWAHWGLGGAVPGYDRKSSGGTKISTYTATGTVGAFNITSGQTFVYNWTDGTPDATVSNSESGVNVPAVGNNFVFTAPADTTQKILKVYCGGWQSNGKITAHLSDGSAVDYVDSSQSAGVNASFNVVYTLTYKAASAGQTLTVTWKENADNSGNGTANTSLHAATLH